MDTPTSFLGDTDTRKRCQHLGFLLAPHATFGQLAWQTPQKRCAFIKELNGPSHDFCKELAQGSILHSVFGSCSESASRSSCPQDRGSNRQLEIQLQGWPIPWTSSFFGCSHRNQQSHLPLKIKSSGVTWIIPSPGTSISAIINRANVVNDGNMSINQFFPFVPRIL